MARGALFSSDHQRSRSRSPEKYKGKSKRHKQSAQSSEDTKSLRALKFKHLSTLKVNQNGTDVCWHYQVNRCRVGDLACTCAPDAAVAPRTRFSGVSHSAQLRLLQVVSLQMARVRTFTCSQFLQTFSSGVFAGSCFCFSFWSTCSAPSATFSASSIQHVFASSHWCSHVVHSVSFCSFLVQMYVLTTSSTTIVVTAASLFAETVTWISVLTQFSHPSVDDAVWTGSEISILAKTNFTATSECVCPAAEL